ncbi:MAG: hypothetical protein AAB846_02275 [Patescibacteria group bacterium]
MERRETQETIDVKTLTKRAISLYLKQAAGKEVDPDKIAKLREDTHLFPDEKEFKDFRVAVGTTALQGKFKFGEKNAGSEIMGILFEEQDRQLYDSIVILSQALEMAPRDYTITTMLNINDEMEARRRIEKAGNAPEEIAQAERTLKEFLATKAGASIREQMLLRQEVAREKMLTEDIEDAFIRPKTAKEIKHELREEQKRIKALWEKLKEEPFEQAPLTTQRIINSRALAEELQLELKHKPKNKNGKKPDAAIETPPEEEVSRKWAKALKRSAHQLRLDAEEDLLLPEETKKLQSRAAMYDAEANRLLAGPYTPAAETTS